LTIFCFVGTERKVRCHTTGAGAVDFEDFAAARKEQDNVPMADTEESGKHAACTRLFLVSIQAATKVGFADSA
jgi:hypothetical protein